MVNFKECGKMVGEYETITCSYKHKFFNIWFLSTGVLQESLLNQFYFSSCNIGAGDLF